MEWGHMRYCIHNITMGESTRRAVGTFDKTYWTKHYFSILVLAQHYISLLSLSHSVRLVLLRLIFFFTY